jgi:hypothetical protein
MKNTLENILFVAVIFGATYLFGSFVAWTFNPYLWDSWGRMAIAFIAFILSIKVLAIIND